MADGMHETVISFRDHLVELGRSPNTVRQYTWQVQQFMGYVKKDPARVTREDLSRYRHHLAVDRSYKKNSLYLATKAIQSFFEFNGLDTARDLAPPKRSRSNPKFLSEAEAHRLLRASEEDPRDHAILVVMAYTGLRVSEVVGLDCEHVDLAERTISVVSGKGDKDRLVVFANQTAVALRRWMEHREPTGHDALFINRRGGRITQRSVQRIVGRYAEAAGIRKRVTPHVLRHTMATTLLRHGADIRIIQELLGHASVATTQIYTHVDDAMLRTAYDRAAPEY
jgi:integrase/recombinase XerD